MASSREFSGHCRGRAVNDALHHPYTLRAITGVMVHYCLGCGANGCAFRADDDLVLKISYHEGEAPLADVVKGLGRPWPFLPIFHGSWIVSGNELGGREDDRLGITLREDLIDFSPDHPRQYIAEATGLLSDAMGAETATELLAVRRSLSSVLEDMTSLDGLALRMLADFAIWSRHYGLGFDLMEFSGSLSITNLGQSLRDDAVVIRDLGNFDPTPDAMKKLRRATLQRARERSAR